MSLSESTPWPALTIQGTFLAANIAFMLNGETNANILRSFTLVVILFAVQATAGSARFLWLFPVKKNEPSQTRTGLDTLLLRGMILFAAFFFFLGATDSWEPRKSLEFAFAVLIIGLAFAFCWRIERVQRLNDWVIDYLSQDKRSGPEKSEKQPASGDFRGMPRSSLPESDPIESSGAFTAVVTTDRNTSTRDWDE